MKLPALLHRRGLATMTWLRNETPYIIGAICLLAAIVIASIWVGHTFGEPYGFALLGWLFGVLQGMEIAARWLRPSPSETDFCERKVT